MSAPDYKALYETELAKNAALSRCMLEVANDLRALDGLYISGDGALSMAARLEAARAANYSAVSPSSEARCVWCGHSEKHETAAQAADAVMRHVQECKKSPYAILLAEAEQVECERDSAIKERDEARGAYAVAVIERRAARQETERIRCLIRELSDQDARRRHIFEVEGSR